MRKILYIAYLLCCLIPLHSHAQDVEETIKESEISEWLNKTKEDTYKFHYLEAVRQKNIGNNDSAFVLLQKCLEIDSLASEGHFAIAQLYRAEHLDDLALVHLKRAVETDSLNDEFAEALAEYYLERNMVDEGNAVYEKLSKMFPDRSEYLEILSRIYQYKKDYKKLLATLNRIEVLDGMSEDLTLSKMQVYSMLGEEKEAYEELNKLVSSHPNDLAYKVMKGNWLLSNGRKEEAYDTFNDVLKEEPSNALAQMSLMDYHRLQGNNAAADTLLYAMLENPKTEPETRIQLMRQAVSDSEANGGDSLRICEIFSRVLSLPQKTSEMAEMQLVYLTMKEAPKEKIREAIDKLLSIDPEHIQARLQLIDMMWRDTMDVNFMRECQKAIDYMPNEPTLYYFLSLAQYTDDQNKEAIKTLETGVTKINADTNKDMASEMYMILADLYYKEKRTNDAFAAYDSCLVYKSDNITALNNYAYYLSLENRELKKAEQMSHTTITAEPQSTTYLDTYAWILFKMERYEEARIYIDQVLKIDSVDIPADELEHAGDIYFKLGEKRQAGEYWQKALDKDTKNANLIRKKLKKVK